MTGSSIATVKFLSTIERKNQWRVMSLTNLGVDDEIGNTALVAADLEVDEALLAPFRTPRVAHNPTATN